MEFEGIEVATSHDKLNILIEGCLSLKNALEGEIIDQSVELLNILKVNLAKLENVVKPELNLNNNLLKDEKWKTKKRVGAFEWKVR